MRHHFVKYKGFLYTFYTERHMRSWLEGKPGAVILAPDHPEAIEQEALRRDAEKVRFDSLAQIGGSHG